MTSLDNSRVRCFLSMIWLTVFIYIKAQILLIFNFSFSLLRYGPPSYGFNLSFHFFFSFENKIWMIKITPCQIPTTWYKTSPSKIFHSPPPDWGGNPSFTPYHWKPWVVVYFVAIKPKFEYYKITLLTIDLKYYGKKDWTQNRRYQFWKITLMKRLILVFECWLYNFIVSCL